MVERRAFERFQKSYPVAIKRIGSSSSFPCKTIDISRTGVAVKSKDRLLIPSIISLDITPTSKYPPITTEAQLIWNRTSSEDDSSYYGLRFTEVEEDSSLTLRRMLGYEVDHIVTASYLPEQIVTNQDIIKMGFRGPAFVLERGLGVKERRAAAPDETAADMMAKVAKKILDKAGVLPQSLDCIICSTDPGDAVAPDTACAVQAKIGASCPAFGVSMSCTGWIVGVDFALRRLAGSENRILVLASSVGSRIFFRNPRDRAIFGDGAGGILLESHHLARFLAIGEIADGRYYSKIFVPYPWSIKPSEIPEKYKGSFFMSPNQKAFFDALDYYLRRFTDRLLSEAKVNLADIDLFLLHYPSKPLFERSLKILGVSRSKTFSRFDSYGNLVAAEMPVFLNEAVDTARIKKGDLIFMLPYGAGVTMGGLIMRY